MCCPRPGSTSWSSIRSTSGRAGVQDRHRGQPLAVPHLPVRPRQPEPGSAEDPPRPARAEPGSPLAHRTAGSEAASHPEGPGPQPHPHRRHPQPGHPRRQPSPHCRRPPCRRVAGDHPVGAELACPQEARRSRRCAELRTRRAQPVEPGRPPAAVRPRHRPHRSCQPAHRGGPGPVRRPDPSAGDHTGRQPRVGHGDPHRTGKRRSGRIRHRNPVLRALLIECAHAAVRKRDTPFRGYQESSNSRRGYKRAIVAVAHKLLRTIHAMLRERTPCADPGIDEEAISIGRKAGQWLRKLEQYGYASRANAQDQPDMPA